MHRNEHLELLGLSLTWNVEVFGKQYGHCRYHSPFRVVDTSLGLGISPYRS